MTLLACGSATVPATVGYTGTAGCNSDHHYDSYDSAALPISVRFVDSGQCECVKAAVNKEHHDLTWRQEARLGHLYCKLTEVLLSTTRHT